MTVNEIDGKVNAIKFLRAIGRRLTVTDNGKGEVTVSANTIDLKTALDAVERILALGAKGVR